MSKKTGRQGPEDTNEAAFRVVQSIIAKTEGRSEEDAPEDLSAVRAKAGRQGGLKGGKARAVSLTPERKAEIARNAAACRWKKKP